MNKQNNGGPAFPFAIAVGGDAGIVTSDEMGVYGLSIRDYFAAKALIGYLQASAQHGWGDPNEHQAKQAARNAYLVADAMLKARG